MVDLMSAARTQPTIHKPSAKETAASIQHGTTPALGISAAKAPDLRFQFSFKLGCPLSFGDVSCC